MVFTCVSVLYDVGARAAGVQPPIWTSAATEYAMLLLTMAISPYLVRHQGHVRIEILSRALPTAARALLHRGVSLVAFGVCMAVVVIAVRMGLDTHGRGELDIRSIELPRWVLFAAIATGFGLCAVEFLRQGLSPVTEGGETAGGL
nr:TRAP transporter small permease [Aminobacter carboxidus]